MIALHPKPRLLACLVAFWFASALSHAAAARRPNFLFIYTDDQRWDAMGVVQREHGERGRFPWFTTPHMDRLAAGGVRFREAFVTLSLCSPSRAAFLTGRYNHLNGVADNRTPFPENNVTHASLMRATGYASSSDHTAFFGMGVDAVATAIQIQWPSGTKQHLGNVTCDHYLTVEEP